MGGKLVTGDEKSQAESRVEFLARIQRQDSAIGEIKLSKDKEYNK